MIMGDDMEEKGAREAEREREREREKEWERGFSKMETPPFP
jgi:hypothetical protein